MHEHKDKNMLQNIKLPKRKGKLWISIRSFCSWFSVLIFLSVGCTPGEAPVFTFNMNTGEFYSVDTIVRVNMQIEAYRKGSTSKLKLLDIYCRDSTGVGNFRLPLFAPEEIEKVNYCKIRAYDTTLTGVFRERAQEVRFFIVSNKANNLRTYTTDTLINLARQSDNPVLIFSYNTWY